MTPRFWPAGAACVAIVWTTACAAPPDVLVVGGDECGDIRPPASARKVYGGTLAPTHVALTAGEILAVGDLGTCSGALIAPTWVATAAHCGFAPGVAFCVGADPADADRCVPGVRADDHPWADITLIELERDPRELVPSIVPLPIMTEAMDPEWIGRTAEAAGYGDDDGGGSGTRYFTAEPIVDISDELVTVDGEGARGLCSGDSGGPLLVIASDGTVRVAGTLSFGDASCRDVDSFVRVDTRRVWIETRTGPTTATRCGVVTAAGRCNRGDALWCEHGTLVREPCAAGARCGWDDAAAGFRCITGDDPCRGLDVVGRCAGGVAEWCERGDPQSRDCAGCDMECRELPTGAYCH